MDSRIPVHGGWPLLGALPGLRRDVLKELERAAEKGDLVRLALPALPPVFLLTCPDGIRQVLQTRAESYGRTRFHDRLKPVMGEGLVTADGEHWRRQRQFLQPHFNASAVRRFVPTITAAVRGRARLWEGADGTGTEIDVAEEMSVLTLEIILRCMFGRAATDDISSAIREAQAYIAASFWRSFDWPTWLPTPANRRFRRALSTMEGAVKHILEARVGSDDHDDLLRSLESVYSPSACPAGQGEERLLRDEAMTILLAGHETSAVALAWALHLVALNGDVADEIRAEATNTLGEAGPSDDNASSLVRTRAVVNEAMRLFPPVPWSARRARTDDQLLGQLIPAGAIVIFSPWLLHRDKRWWSSPVVFDPGRFLGERNKRRRPWSFIPFGGGPRTCIGLHLAMTEMVVVLAMIVRDFELSLADRATPTPQALVTLRPTKPLPITFKPIIAKKRLPY